jgi:hypothetical protein
MDMMFDRRALGGSVSSSTHHRCDWSGSTAHPIGGMVRQEKGCSSVSPYIRSLCCLILALLHVYSSPPQRICDFLDRLGKASVVFLVVAFRIGCLDGSLEHR